MTTPSKQVPPVVYLAAPNSGEAPPKFKERKIAHLAPGEADEIAPIIHSSSTNLLYDLLIQNLGTLCRAQQSTSGKHVIRESAANVFKEITGLTQTFDVPTLMVKFPDGTIGLESAKEELKAMGMTEFPGQADTWTGTPEAKYLSAIMSRKPLKARASAGFVDLNGYLAFVYAMKGLQIFTSLSRRIAENTIPNIVIKDGDSESGGADQTQVLYPLGSNSGVDVKGYIPKGETVYHTSMSILAMPYDDTKLIMGEFATMTNPNLTSQAGIFFPYFDGLLLPDHTLVRHVFQESFYHLLGADLDQCNRMWERLRTGFRQIAYLPIGRLLSHAYMGIKYAKQTRGSLTLVHEGSEYKGFVIQSVGLECRLYGRDVVGQDKDVLRKQLQGLSEHDKALEAIVKILNTPTDDDGDQLYSFGVVDINSSSRLRGVLYSVDMDVFSNHKKALRENIEKLRFGDDYARITTKNILLFLQFVASDNFELIMDLPSYFYPGNMFATDAVSVGLAIFGPKCPVFSYAEEGKCQTWQLPRDLKAEDKNLELVENKDKPDLPKKRRLQYLPVAVNTHPVAVASFNKILKTGKLNIPFAKKGSNEFTDGSKCHLKIGEAKEFMQVYGLLKSLSAETRGARATGKRGREDDTERKNVKKARETYEEDANLV